MSEAPYPSLMSDTVEQTSGTETQGTQGHRTTRAAAELRGRSDLPFSPDVGGSPTLPLGVCPAPLPHVAGCVWLARPVALAGAGGGSPGLWLPPRGPSAESGHWRETTALLAPPAGVLAWCLRLPRAFWGISRDLKSPFSETTPSSSGCSSGERVCGAPRRGRRADLLLFLNSELGFGSRYYTV